MKEKKCCETIRGSQNDMSNIAVIKRRDEKDWEKTNNSATTTYVTFHKAICDLTIGQTKMISRDLIVIE